MKNRKSAVKKPNRCSEKKKTCSENAFTAEFRFFHCSVSGFSLQVFFFSLQGLFFSLQVFYFSLQRFRFSLHVFGFFTALFLNSTALFRPGRKPKLCSGANFRPIEFLDLYLPTACSPSREAKGESRACYPSNGLKVRVVLVIPVTG